MDDGPAMGACFWASELALAGVRRALLSNAADGWMRAWCAGAAPCAGGRGVGYHKMGAVPGSAGFSFFFLLLSNKYLRLLSYKYTEIPLFASPSERILLLNILPVVEQESPATPHPVHQISQHRITGNTRLQTSINLPGAIPSSPTAIAKS